MAQVLDPQCAAPSSNEATPDVSLPAVPEAPALPVTFAPSRETTIALFGAMEIMLVGVIGASVARLRTWEPEACAAALGRLDPKLGVASLVLLLVGSYGLERARAAARSRGAAAATGWLGGTMVSGFGFIALRVFACAGLARGPRLPLDAVFLVATAFQALHVLLAVVLVAWGFARTRPHTATPIYQAAATRFSAIGLFWHTGAIVSAGLLAVFELGLTELLHSVSTGGVLAAGSLTAIASTLLVAALARRSLARGSVVLFAMFLAFVSTSAVALEGASRAQADPFVSERPADPALPFGGTRADMKARERLGDVERAEQKLRADLAAERALTAKEGSAKAGPERPEVSAEGLARAKDVYGTRCASCHGAQGKGDGPGAFAIKPPPRDYTDAEWQGSVTNEALSMAISKGGAAVGKSFMMPPLSADLRKDPEIVAGLVALVRDFGKPQVR